LEGIIYIAFFLFGGLAIARYWLPRHRPLVRWYVGASVGLLLMLWLPVLWAYLIAFTHTAQLLAALTLCLLVMLAYLTRDPHKRVRFGEEDRRMLRAVLWVAVPLTALAGVLEVTHSILPAADGSYHVGQSTYGDLSLHLAITTSIVNAHFPLQNSLMVGATMAYPYLADSFASTLYLLGLSLPAAMSVSGTLLCASVFTGFALLCAQLARRRGTVWLATLLLFVNGGLGFFYTLSGTVENGVTTTAWDHLRTMMTGFYQTPTNQPDPNNLRWVNIICDMLVPQRGILGGWAMLLPALNLLIPPLALRRRHTARALVLTGIIAGGMPLLHTHSFLALAVVSFGMMLYVVVTAPRNRRMEAFKPFLLYGGIALALSLPQLINFTFVQATRSDFFLRFQFNWCNNRGGAGLVDPYFWFYIKNIGLPYLLILLALLQLRKGDLREEADAAAALTDGLYSPDPGDASAEAAAGGVVAAHGIVATDETAAASGTIAADETVTAGEAVTAEGIAADVVRDASLGLGAQNQPTATIVKSGAIGASDVNAENPDAEGDDSPEAETPARASLYAHDMPAYGTPNLPHPASDDYSQPTLDLPFTRPLPPERLRAAAFSPDDSDRVGVMRAVTGTSGAEASHRPLLEEIFHSTYHTDEAAEAAARANALTDGQPETCFAEKPPARDWVRQNRMLALGAFLLLLLAELVLFQPNEYDNNKLIYVWFMLCLPMAADYALDLFARLKGLGGRRALATLFLIACFLSGGLTIARELVSDYQAYTAADIAVADFVRENTPEHSVFITGNQHLNPIASLAGRTILCGSDIYLFYHGFNTTARKEEVRQFYEAPAEHLDLLARYQVQYVYLSPSEWYNYNVDADALRQLFPTAYESDDGAYLVLTVPESYRKTQATQTAVTPSPTPDPALNPASPG